MDFFQRPTKAFLDGKGRVATLGMLIVDHFQVRDEAGTPVLVDGEAVTMVAARQFLLPAHCGIVVDQGTDFPQAFVDELERLGKEMIWLRRRNGKTTRALNIYSGHRIGEGQQSFKYLTPQLRLTLKDLVLSPSPFATATPPEWIHVVCGNPRMRAIVDELGGLRENQESAVTIRLAWEPLPFSCVPQQLDEMLSLASVVTVFSPNLLELQSVLGLAPSSPPCHMEAQMAAETFCQHLEKRYSDCRPPVIVVRAGELGSFTLSSSWTGWVPAYWRESEREKVVDVTGGGNAFLGGFLAGLLVSSGDTKVASIYASTAASFAIQQRGPPHLENIDGQELWNGEIVWERLQAMASRVQPLELYT
nr:hypothetical protein L204_02048 [Cryptococcus depauperatus CBS 7855]